MVEEEAAPCWLESPPVPETADLGLVAGVVDIVRQEMALEIGSSVEAEQEMAVH